MTPDVSSAATHAESVDVLAAQWCARLNLGRPRAVRQLSGGRSGSLVLALEVGGNCLVVKVTTAKARLARAEIEAHLLESGGLPAAITPELVASARGHGWVAIATREGAPIGPAQHVNDYTWVLIADGLGRLHRAVVGGDGFERLPPSDTGPDLGAWTTLNAGDEALRGARRLAEAPTSTLPMVVEHGDSHLDNIVWGPTGEVMWIDWQEAHIGDGLADLVFLWQRAEFAGARPPRAEMTARYSRLRLLDPIEVQALIDRTELRLLLHSWPPFLGLGTAQARETMRRRLVTLTNR